MNDDLEKIFIEGNNRFQWKLLRGIESIDMGSKDPRYPVLILTCMDPRIDIHRIFQLELGSVFVLRNAGNVITEDVIRSMIIAINEYNIEYIIVLGHIECGMKKVHMYDLRNNLDSSTLKKVYKTSTNLMFGLRQYFRLFVDEITNIKNQIKSIRDSESISSEIKIIQMLYDPNTGWIFNENDLKEYTFYDSFNKDYHRLIQNKKIKFVDYVEHMKEELINSDSIQNIEPLETPEKQFNHKLVTDKQIEPSLVEKSLEKLPYTEPNKDTQEKPIRIPKITVPKIYIPKIRVYVPNIKRKN